MLATSVTATHPREAGKDDIVDRRYRVRREIAKGGMGTVTEVEHVVTGARLALKTLRGSVLANGVARERLLREAKSLGSLRHPGVVAVIDAGFCPLHGPFVAFEMIEGRPLDGLLLARGRLGVEQSVALAFELADVLDYVHRHGVLHRDVKPSNVIIADTPVGDRVELIDFGIAAQQRAPEARLTTEGEVLCTVEYASPEQLMTPHQVDERSDVYSAAALLYECLTGTVPYTGPLTAIIARHAMGTPAPQASSHRPDIPGALNALLERALRPNPDERFQSARELRDECEKVLGAPPPALALLETAGSSASRTAETDQAPDPLPGRPIQANQFTAPARPPPLPTPAITAAVQAPERQAPPRQAPPRQAPPRQAPQRRFERAAYVTPVRVLLGSRSLDGRTEDISEGGVLLVTEGLCDADQVVDLKMPLPGSGRVASLKAKTRWVRKNRDRRALGLEFVDPPEDVCADIRLYVSLMGAERR